MSSVLDLPPELIERIAENMIAFKDIKQLRLACRQLGQFLEAQVLHTIVFSINKNTLEKSIGMLRYLTTPRLSEATCRATRRLIIGSLSPSFDPTNFSVQITGDAIAGWLPTTMSPAHQGDEVAAATKCVKLFLFDALVSLKNLYSVGWKMGSQDEDWAQTIVMEALKSIPSLRNLSVTLAHPRIALQLDLLPQLSEITVKHGTAGVQNPYNLQTFANLAKLIAESSPGQLTSIQVERYPPISTYACAEPSLQELFALIPESAYPLRIRHLGISNSFVKFDPATTQHLRCLTSLDLSNIISPRNTITPRALFASDPITRAPQPVAPEIYEKQCAVGSTVDQLWRDFALLGIHLDAISLDQVVPAFFEYLQSYTGLKKLSLKATKFDTGRESDAVASTFFDTVLPIHAASLEDLDIEAHHEGLWCFGENNVFILSECRSLRRLRMCILSDQMKRSRISGSEAPFIAEDTIDNLLHIAAAYMPRLASLTISPANKEAYRGSRALLHCTRVTSRIIEHILAYHAPSSFSRLPQIHVGGKVFEPAPTPLSESQTSTEWHWRYWLASHSKEIE